MSGRKPNPEEYGTPDNRTERWDSYPPESPYDPPPPYAPTHSWTSQDFAPYQGGYSENTPILSPSPKHELGFDDLGIRRGFIRKVFALIGVQLLLVVGLIALFLFEDNTRNYIQRHSWLYWASYVVFLVTYMSISMCEGIRRKVPGNYLAFFLLTLSLGYMTAMISSYYDTKIVLMALGLCALSCLGIIIFSFQSKIDCTRYIGTVSLLSLLLMVFAIFLLLFGFGLHQNVMWLVYSGLAALLFMAYLIIDVQLLMGKRKYALSPEDYVYAASQIFVDIVYIFIMLLSILGATRNN